MEMQTFYANLFILNTAGTRANSMRRPVEVKRHFAFFFP
jgi:hypothetical protein